MTKTRKRVLARFVSIMLIALLIIANPGMLNTGNGQASAAVNYDNIPPLLITEIVPDSTNVGDTDGYEYIEVYNNSDQPINFKDYQIIYRYPATHDEDINWIPNNRDIDIAPGGSLVLWMENANNQNSTVADFNANYGVNLVENKNIVRMSGGMANQRLRDILIRTNTGHEIVRAEYNKAEFDVAEDMGILYKYPEDGTNKMIKVSAGENRGTPGTVAAELVPEEPVSIDTHAKPTIDDKTSSAQKLDNIEVQVEAADDFLLSTLTLHYRNSGATDYHTLNLEGDLEAGVFRHQIPVSDVIGADKLEYYLEATNGFNTTTTDLATIDVEQAVGSDVPPLLITEITPDSDNLNGANAYEFLEVYNNTDQVIDFGNYRILYRGPLATDDVVWFSGLDGTMIDPGGNLVLWVDNGKNAEADIADFKNNYGITEEINIVKAPAGGGMANGAERDLSIGTNIGEKFITASYNKPGNKDVVKNKGIFYHFPIGSDQMIKVRTGLDATPGTVEADLVPEQLNVIDPNQDITIEDMTAGETVKPGDSIEVVVSAEDDLKVTGMTLKYKNSSEETFTSVDLVRDSDRLFRHTIHVPGDAGIEDIIYYFEATNGLKTTESAHKQIDVALTSTPDIPENPTPENDAVDIQKNPTLSVQVSDVLGGALDVTFYEGKSFNTSNTDQVKIFQNATDVEPPAVRVPEGETELTTEEYEALSALNGEKVSLDSDDKFPYQRFEVTLDTASLEHDDVEAVWHGSSLEGRKVSLYAWNLTTEVWDMVDNIVADSNETFTLSGDVSVADYVDGHVLNILVQDEIPAKAAGYEIGDEPNFEDFDYNFVWLADTQFYTEVFPWHYENQVNWIADNKDNMNIEYVFHSGDIVNTWNREYQWEYADKYMKVLEDADVPYGILAGNHDIELPQMDYSQFYYKYFGADRFADQPYYGGSFQNNRGHYDLISVEGVDFIMVHMGWQPQADGIAWMNEVLQAHPNRVAILNFHQYLDAKGITAMGQIIFDEVVVPNENVQVVIGGHHLGSNAMTQEVEDANGKKRIVHELMGNFQGVTEGGLGFFNMMSFDISTNSMYITSYSPSLDEYNYYDDTPYRIELDLAPMTKNVATDYFEVNTYAGKEIGSVADVASGETAEMVWSDLKAGAPYSWYVSVTNAEGVETLSDMWHFKTEGDPAADIKEVPVIHAEDISLTVGDTFTELENVTATDALDGDLTGQIKVIENTVNTDEVGSYDVTYEVTNSYGARTTKTITVTVKEAEVTTPPVDEPKDPEDPEEPVDPVDPEDPEDPEKPADPEDPEKPGNKDDDSGDKGNGEELPKTATNMYTWLVLGMLLLVGAGMAALYHNRKKANI